MQVVVMNKKKSSPLVIAFRVIAAITFMLKPIYNVQGIYNTMSVHINTWLIIVGAMFYGLLSFGLFWLIGNIVYNNISVSKYFPFNENGECAVPRDKYLTKLYAVAIVNNLVIAGLNAMLYLIPVATSFVLMVAPRLISIISTIIFTVILGVSCAKGKLKEYTVAMALPVFFLFIALGV